ncbi:cysteine desulfurase [bacterium]|nr:cysteine desulfurase [bacterium]
MIYCDHNATTPLDPSVLEAMLPYLAERWGNPSSPYRFGSEVRLALEQARKRIADCLACLPAELVFCASGTESDNMALRGVARALREKGRHIVTSVIEHHAVLNTCKALEREGFRLSYVPVSSAGVVELDELEASLCDETILVSVMHANNETGVVQPIEQIAALTGSRGILFHTDAVQTMGKLPISCSGIGADLISISAHKFYGPKGIALLYIRTGTPITPIVTGGAQERDLRAGTENVAGIIGMTEALSLACEHQESEAKRLGGLRDRLEHLVLDAVPEVKINGADATRVPNTSNMTFAAIEGESIVLGMDLRGICLATGSACSTGMPEPSHVLRAMGLTARAAQSSVRFSLGRSTREADIDTIVGELQAVVSRLRAISCIGGGPA